MAGKISELTALAAIALDDLLEVLDVSDTSMAASGTNKKGTVALSLGFPLRGVAEGRLTTESGVPLSTSDRTAQGTIYYAPYVGTRIALYDGTGWKLHTFTERSLALSSLTSGKNYDVFLYDNSGTLTLELSAAWTNDTTRADALGTQDGVTVKSGTPTRRWLGTIRTTGTASTEDSLTKRFVWNWQNREPRKLLKDMGSSSHAYNSGTVRQYNNDAAAQVEFVVGLAGLAASFSANGILDTTTATVTRIGLGENVTNAYTVGALVDLQIIGIARLAVTLPMEPRLGYSAMTLLQQSSASGTHTFDFGRVLGVLPC